MNQTLFATEAVRLRPKLVATARRYVGATEAEDIVQDAMLKLWLMHEQLEDNIEPLATVVVRNLSLNRLRRLRPTTTLAEADNGDLAETPDEPADEARYEAVSDIIQTLPTAQKIIIMLRHDSDMGYADIARLTGSTEAAVRKSASRSYRYIRHMYRVVAALLLLAVGITITLRLYSDRQFSRRHEGSYMIVNGQRIDDLRRLRPEIERTLALATEMERQPDAFSEAEARVLDNIDDPEERERIRQLLE